VNVTPNSLLSESLARPGARIFHRTLARIGEEHVGRFVAAGVLVPEAPLTELGPCSCEVDDCTRVVVRAQGRVYSVCPNSRLSNEEITEEHLRSYGFNEAEWLRRFAVANDLKGGPQEHTPRLAYLGTRSFPGGGAAVLLLRDIRKDELLTLRMMLKVKHPEQPCILLVPKRPRLDEGDVAVLALEGHRLVVLTEALATGESLRINWPSSSVSSDPAKEPAATARLIIRKTSKAAILDGVVLKLQPLPFALLLFLAENATPELLPVPSSLIFEEVWQTNSAADVELFDVQVNDHVSKIRKAFRKQLGLSAMESQKLLFNEKGKGFCLAIPPDQIRFL